MYFPSNCRYCRPKSSHNITVKVMRVIWQIDHVWYRLNDFWQVMVKEKGWNNNCTCTVIAFHWIGWMIKLKCLRRNARRYSHSKKRGCEIKWLGLFPSILWPIERECYCKLDRSQAQVQKKSPSLILHLVQNCWIGVWFILEDLGPPPPLFLYTPSLAFQFYDFQNCQQFPLCVSNVNEDIMALSKPAIHSKGTVTA